MEEEYKNYPFYDWVPKPLGIIFMINPLRADDYDEWRLFCQQRRDDERARHPVGIHRLCGLLHLDRNGGFLAVLL